MSYHQGPNNSRRSSSRILKFAEYTALAASVTGTIVATASQQVIYAAAPLTISLSLNLINRQRFARQIQHRLTAHIEEVEQPLSALNQQISQFPPTLRAEFEQQIAHLASQISTTQTIQSDIIARFSQFEAQLSELTQQLSSEIRAIEQQILSPPNVPSFADLQVLQQSLEHLQEQVDVVQNQTQQLQIQTQISEIDIDSLSVIQQSIQQLFDRTANLNNQFTALDTQSILNALNSTDLQALRQSLEQLRERIGVVEVQMRHLQTQTSTSENSTFSVIQQSIQQLFDHTNSLKEQLTALETQSIQPLLDRFSIFEIETLQPLLDRLAELEDRMQDQAVEPPPPPPELEELDLHLGIDFGTTYTKVCFRDISRNASEIVTFADDETDLETALLPTKIGILLDGTLVTGLTATEWQEYESRVETTVEFIKMRLADLDLPQETETWRLEKLPDLDQPETVENLCAYYLSRVISRSQSWIRRCKPQLIANQQIVWSANVGVPVAYCDSPAIQRFERVLSLAWLLSNEPQTGWFTLDRLAKQLNHLRSRLAKETIDCFAVPEIAAEAWAFFDSREADDGFYIFFDIGDGTLDGTAFYYYKEDGEPKVDFYTAKVDPLGVTALSQQLAKELNQPEQEIKIMVQGEQSSSHTNIASSQSRKAIQEFVAKTIQKSKQNLYQNFPNGWLPGVARPVLKEPLKIFIGGGGSETAFYRETIISVHSEFDLKAAGIAPFLLKPIPMPKDLELNQLKKQEFHRFAVAYGLSIPAYEGAKARLPGQVTNSQVPEIGVHIVSPPPNYEDGKDYD